MPCFVTSSTKKNEEKKKEQVHVAGMFKNILKKYILWLFFSTLKTPLELKKKGFLHSEIVTKYNQLLSK